MSIYQNPTEDSDDEDERITELQSQIDELRQLLNPSHAHTNAIIEKNPAPADGLRVRPTELPIYDGSRSNYPAWRRIVLMIFRMDWNAFQYTDTRAFLLTYTVLRGEVQNKASTFFDAGGTDRQRRLDDFIESLDRGNLDGTRVDKACDQLYNLRMGDNQRWSSFYPTWASKLTEAEGDLWNEHPKTTMLRNALNGRLRQS
ncbi:hypothetical protein K3495_g5131 [Podosphaera aphanis]|nr:hypothetical protein K3495_g5131 [Podosphaera aphanis]